MSDLKTITDRIKFYRDSKGYRKGEFDRLCGLSNGYLNSTSTPGSNKLEDILRNCKDLNRNWLLYNEGEMLLKEESEFMKFNEGSKFSPIGTTTTAPLISQYAAAGYLMGYSDQEYIEQQPVYTATKKYSGGNYVAFEIRGDSMDDGLKRSISNGDVVLGKELKKEYWKCKLHLPRIFIIVHRESGILCKEIVEHNCDNGIITCHSFNPQNRDFELDLNDIAQLFYLKEITRAHEEYH